MLFRTSCRIWSRWTVTQTCFQDCHFALRCLYSESINGVYCPDDKILVAVLLLLNNCCHWSFLWIELCVSIDCLSPYIMIRFGFVLLQVHTLFVANHLTNEDWSIAPFGSLLASVRFGYDWALTTWEVSLSCPSLGPGGQHHQGVLGHQAVVTPKREQWEVGERGSSLCYFEKDITIEWIWHCVYAETSIVTSWWNVDNFFFLYVLWFPVFSALRISYSCT